MRILSATVLALLTTATAIAAAGESDPTAGAVLAAKWTYSTDGGKTFGSEAPRITGTGSPNLGIARTTAKTEFTIDDPAKIGILKIATKNPIGAFTLTDANSVDRYNVGSTPTLLEAKIVLNGKSTDLGHAPNTLYRYLAIERSDLKPGINTLQLTGRFWHKNYGAGSVPCDLQLEIIPADRAALDRLPILGMVGDDYFGVACRSVIPSQFTVAVTPLDPPGIETRQAFGPVRQLKARMPLSAGTKKFRYSVTVTAGGASQSYGPYEVRVPKRGVGFRFMAAGGTATYSDSPEVGNFMAKVREVNPDLLIHTGNYQNCNAWDFIWTRDFFRDVQPTLARIPLLPTANITEMISSESFARTFYFPPDDSDWSQWSVVVGNVRFVSIEAYSQSSDPTDAGVKWLEKVLRGAKEDYVLVLNAHAAGCLPVGGGKWYQQGTKHTTAKIDPLLIKYNVTATIGNMCRGYQRIEPPAGQGVPIILTGRAGGYIGLRPNIALTRSQDSKASSGDDHYVLFEVKSDGLEMKTIGFNGQLIDTRTFQPRK